MPAAEPNDLSDFLEILQQLVREPSVVGTEDSFFRVLRRELEEVDVTVERHLGVLVARGRDPDSIVLSAHIDRHGLLCTGPNEFQYAAFIAGNRGELTGDSVSEQDLVLRKKDSTGLFDADFTVEIQDHCRDLGIPYSYKDSWIEAQNENRAKSMSLGRTELGRLWRSGRNVPLARMIVAIMPRSRSRRHEWGRRVG